VQYLHPKKQKMRQPVMHSSQHSASTSSYLLISHYFCILLFVGEGVVVLAVAFVVVSVY
jgi:hypothetical protein